MKINSNIVIPVAFLLVCLKVCSYAMDNELELTETLNQLQNPPEHEAERAQAIDLDDEEILQEEIENPPQLPEVGQEIHADGSNEECSSSQAPPAPAWAEEPPEFQPLNIPPLTLNSQTIMPQPPQPPAWDDEAWKLHNYFELKR